MKRYLVGLVFVGVLGIFDSTAQSAIVDIDCEFAIAYWGPGNADYMWSFDYELQQLTTIEEFYNPLDLYPYVIRVRGSTDSDDSTFSVTRIITNNTGIAWIGYWLTYGPVWGSRSHEQIVLTGITKLQTVVSQNDYGFQSVEPDRVLDGETFTVQFDVHVNTTTGFFFDDCYQGFIPVPEPVTLTLLGLGGLALLKNRRAED